MIDNLFRGIASSATEEQTLALLSTNGLQIERIVSTGQANPPGFWYDQERAEWVLLVCGSAALLFEDESEARVLNPGDYVVIPAHRRHRVEWTSAQEPTVWLAVHFSPDP